MEENWDQLMQKKATLSQDVLDEICARLTTLLPELAENFLKGDRVGIEDYMTDLYK